MSNYHQTKYKREIFTDFLMEHGYTGKMSIDTEYIMTKDKDNIKVPYEEYLIEPQIVTSLNKSDLSFSDFEEYLDHLNAMKNFTHYVAKSKK